MAASTVILSKLEKWLFESDNYVSKKLSELQVQSGFSPLQVGLLMWTVFHLILYNIPKTEFLVYSIMLAYPIYNTFKKLFAEAAELRPILAYWVFFASFCLIDGFFGHPKPLLFLGEHFFFLMYCPNVNWQEELFFGILAPLCEVLVYSSFKKESWDKVDPYFATILEKVGPERICCFQYRLSPEQIQTMHECCRKSIETHQQPIVIEPSSPTRIHIKEERNIY